MIYPPVASLFIPLPHCRRAKSERVASRHPDGILPVIAPLSTVCWNLLPGGLFSRVAPFCWCSFPGSRGPSRGWLGDPGPSLESMATAGPAPAFDRSSLPSPQPCPQRPMTTTVSTTTVSTSRRRVYSKPAPRRRAQLRRWARRAPCRFAQFHPDGRVGARQDDGVHRVIRVMPGRGGRVAGGTSRGSWPRPDRRRP